MNQFFFFKKEDFLKNGWIYDFVAYIFGFLKSVGIRWCYPIKYVFLLLTLSIFYAVQQRLDGLPIQRQRWKAYNLAFEKTPFSFFIEQFLHTFCQKWTFCYPTTFFESLITHKRIIFEESYMSYSKRQKSCTLIVI